MYIIIAFFVTDDTFVSPELSNTPEPSQSQAELSSEEVEEGPQGSEVRNASPFNHMQSLVTTHQGVTCASSSIMQVPSHPVGGDLGSHEEPETATVKGECRVAVWWSMLVPTTNMMMTCCIIHCTLTTANVSQVCLYLCDQHLLDHRDGSVTKVCGHLCSARVRACVCMLYVRTCYLHTLFLMTLHVN